MRDRAARPDRARAAGAGTLALITAGIFGMVTSVTMIGPLLVDLSREFGISVGRAGLLAAAAAVPQALGSPFAGLASDRFGRRPMIVFALGGVALTCFGAAVAPTFATLVVLRFFAGAIGSFAPTSLMAAVGDLFPAERRAQAMGWFNMGFSVAAIAGVPLIGAVDGLFGWRVAFAAAGAGLAIITLAIRIGFPSPPVDTSSTGVLATYRLVLGVRGLPSVLSANLIERSMFTMMTLYLPSFFMLRYRLTAAEVAPFLSVVALGTILGNLAGGWLGDRFLKIGIFVVGQVVAGVLGLALLGLTWVLGAAVTLGALYGCANAMSRPAFLAIGSELAPRHRGTTFGLLALTNQSGLVIGSAVGAFVIDMAGYRALAIVAACQGAIASALATPLALRSDRR